MEVRIAEEEVKGDDPGAGLLEISQQVRVVGAGPGIAVAYRLKGVFGDLDDDHIGGVEWEGAAESEPVIQGGKLKPLQHIQAQERLPGEENDA